MPPAAVEPRLEFRSFSFTYPQRTAPALADVGFALAPGELAVVCGRNGAGKSTLALAVNGTIPHLLRGATKGEVRVAGRPAGPPRDRAAEVGVVFQDFEAHLVSSTAALEVAFPLENHGVPAAAQRARVAATLELVGLAGFADRVPAELSGGEKQRLAIAAAMALDPPLLVLDEPLTDLDPAGKLTVLDVVRRLRARGVTVLLVEHDPQALLAADRLLALAGGRLAYDGPPGPLLGDPARCAALGVPVWDPAAAAVALGLPGGPPDVGEVADRIRSARPPRSGWTPPPPRPASGEPLIVAAGLTSGYPGGPDVLKDVTLTIRRGECLALLGQNGSGKTTLARHAVGLLAPRQGRLEVAGRPAAAWGQAELSRLAGYVFQNPDHQIFSDTVRDEVAFGARNLGLPAADIAARVTESLAAVGLAGREAEDPFSLTRGERQQLAVASLLAYRPAAVFFDEPTTGLDHGEAAAMMDFIRSLNAGGMTVILITHAMWAAAAYAERTVVMAGGRIVLEGPTRDVFGRADRLAELALAPPPAAQLAGRLGVPALDVAEVVAACGGPAA